MNLTKANHQIPMAKEVNYSTAVTTPFGLFKFTRMPFGLWNTAQMSQRSTDVVLLGLSFVHAYVDNLLVANSSLEEHMQHLRLLFGRLHSDGLIITAEKCEFGFASLELLEHLVDSQGIRPLPSKVQAITYFLRPEYLCQLQRFLRLLEFY